MKKEYFHKEEKLWLERELGKAPDYIAQTQLSASARCWILTSVSIEFGEEYTTMCTCVVSEVKGTDPDIDARLERVKEKKEKQRVEQKKAEKKAAKEKLGQQKVEQRYTIKGKDLKSVTDGFVEKMAMLNSVVESVSGFDVMA